MSSSVYLFIKVFINNCQSPICQAIKLLIVCKVCTYHAKQNLPFLCIFSCGPSLIKVCLFLFRRDLEFGGGIAVFKGDLAGGGPAVFRRDLAGGGQAGGGPAVFRGGPAVSVEEEGEKEVE